MENEGDRNGLLRPGRQNNPAGLASSFARRRSPSAVKPGATSTAGAISGLRAANLAPAFPVFRPVASWGSVTRYRGATVPDSHGVPATSAVIISWGTTISMPRQRTGVTKALRSRLRKRMVSETSDLLVPSEGRTPRVPYPHRSLKSRIALVQRWPVHWRETTVTILHLAIRQVSHGITTRFAVLTAFPLMQHF